ncbi:hypothetical protein PCN061_3131 [Escherichia coli PCN061]|nr:hypothetical protein PCN061_3131 [Escherichia coli PCN061]
MPDVRQTEVSEAWSCSLNLMSVCVCSELLTGVIIALSIDINDR